MGVLYYPGLEGVVTATTSISDIQPDRGSVAYRGHDIFDLVERSTFEEVCFLLLHGRMPDEKALKNFSTSLAQNRDIPRELMDVLKHIPCRADHMDILRTATAFLGTVDPEAADRSREAALRKALRTIAKLPTAIAASHRITQHLAPVYSARQLSHAQNFLYMLSGYGPDEDAVAALDALLILYAEHSSDVSSFTARVAASSFTDYHSAVTAAIGSLKGRMQHDAADAHALQMLLSAEAAEYVEKQIKKVLAKGRWITGFGSESCSRGEARTRIMKQLSGALEEKTRDTGRYSPNEQIEKIMFREKGLHPTVDFYAGQVLHMLGIPAELWVPVFTAGRIAGWSAHVIEQIDNNRMIRPGLEHQGRKNLFLPPMENRKGKSRVSAN